MTVSRLPLAEAAAFLAALFPEVPQGASLQLWTLPEKASSWYASADEAAKAAIARRDRSDIYVGVGLRRAGLGAHERGGSADVVALPGLVADLDIAGPEHAKRRLPKDRADVDRILAALPMQPTLIVATGGGLHCWWLFRELWELDSPAENTRAQGVSRGWGDLIRQAAKRLGFELDSVWDLARLLRVPGTINHKGGKGRPVTLELEDGPRFNPSDFEAFAIDSPVGVVGVHVGGGALDPSAQPPLEKFLSLCDIEPKFRAAWEGKRPDLASQSEIDLSLANHAVQAGWKNDEIVALLIASRRKNGVDLKLREKYYADTIGKARASFEARTAVSEIESVNPDDPTSREAALAEVRSLSGLPVSRIIAVGEIDAEYLVILDDGREISMGPMKLYGLYSTWWQRAYETVRKAPGPWPKVTEWKRALAKVQGLIEVREKEQASEREGVMDLLRSYVSGLATDTSQWTEAQLSLTIHGSAPFRRAGSAFFALQPFQAHVGAIARERYTRPQLIARLKAAGATREEVDTMRAGSRIRRTYWRIPMSVLEGREASLLDNATPDSPDSPGFPGLLKDSLSD